MKDLSVHQTFAWSIIAGHKTSENRSWRTHYRGPLLIHASKFMSQADVAAVARRAKKLGFVIPELSHLPTGGLIGRVDLIDVIERSRDPWFVGPFGWVFANPQPLPFRPVTGQVKCVQRRCVTGLCLKRTAGVDRHAVFSKSLWIRGPFQNLTRK